MVMARDPVAAAAAHVAGRVGRADSGCRPPLGRANVRSKLPKANCEVDAVLAPSRGNDAERASTRQP